MYTACESSSPKTKRYPDGIILDAKVQSAEMSSQKK